MPSFDIVSKIDYAELDNAINGAMREISTRYDFKNSKSQITRNEKQIEMIADDNYKIDQVSEILRTYCVRRKINTGFLNFSDIKDASGGLLKQFVTINEDYLKNSKFKQWDPPQLERNDGSVTNW